jgi:hypothetical protein
LIICHARQTAKDLILGQNGDTINYGGVTMWPFAIVGLVIGAVFVAWAAQREYKCPCCGYKWGNDYTLDQEIAKHQEAERKPRAQG